MIRVLSLGAGMQSSALLFLLDREPDRVGGPVEFAVFADTGDEPAEVYRWLDRLESAVSIPIVRTSKGCLSEDQLTRRTCARSPWHTLNQDGGAGMLPRNCTRDYKIRPIIRAIRARVPKGLHVEQLIGISVDEAHRMKPARDKWLTHRWPLIDIGWTRANCRRYVEASGFGTPPRSACIMCPFRSASEWATLRTNAADWQRAVDFDRRLREVYPPGGGINGIMSAVYVHPQRVPLDEVKLADNAQLRLWGNECEGMCGV